MPNKPSPSSSGFSEQQSPNSEIHATKQSRIEELSDFDDNNSSPDLIKFLDNNDELPLPNLDLFPELNDLTKGKLFKTGFHIRKI